MNDNEEERYIDLDENFERKIRSAKASIDVLLAQEAKNGQELYIGYVSIATSLLTSGLSLLPSRTLQTLTVMKIVNEISSQLDQFEASHESN